MTPFEKYATELGRVSNDAVVEGVHRDDVAEFMAMSAFRLVILNVGNDFSAALNVSLQQKKRIMDFLFTEAINSSCPAMPPQPSKLAIEQPLPSDGPSPE